MGVVDTAKAYAYKKLWGEHSLTLGELVCFLLGLAIIYFGWLGKWSKLVGFIVIFVGMMLF